jgi:hypothetical protein
LPEGIYLSLSEGGKQEAWDRTSTGQVKSTFRSTLHTLHLSSTVVQKMV